MKADSSGAIATCWTTVVSAAFLSILFLPDPAIAQNSSPGRPVLTNEQVSLYARLVQMADLRTVDDTLVQRALAPSSSAPIRAAASLALAQLAKVSRDRVLPILRNYATDADTAVAANAIFGLGLARDTASIAVLATAARRAGSPSVAAVWALGEFGAPAASSVLSLLTESLPPQTTTAALVAESRMPVIDVPLVVRFLQSKYPSVVWGAALVMARRHPRDGVSAVLELSTYSDPQVRTEVANALTKRAVGDSLQERALQALQELLVDDYPPVRIAAVNASATYGRAARGPFRRAVTDPDPNVRIAAAQAAGRVFGNDESVWTELWNADTSFVFQSSIAKSALQAGVQLPILQRWRTSPEWHLRAAAVNTWAASSDTIEAKVNALLASYDVDGRVRAAAYELLGALDSARTDTIIQNILNTAMSDTDIVARQSIPGYVRVPTTADSASRAHPITWYEGIIREIVMPSLSGLPRSATVVTNRGTIRLAFYGDQAPLTVFNFMTLAINGFYNGLKFHRVVPGFVAQDGDSRGDGNGGPGYFIRDELNRLDYERGMVGMALFGSDTGGSQYFITLSPQPHLNGHYTPFARVVTGMAVLDALVQGDRIQSITVQ